MKKFILVISLLLTTVCGVSALTIDELLGKWESNAIKHDPTPEMPLAISEKYALDFQAEQKLDFANEASMTLEIDKGVFVDIFIKARAQGTFNVEGDSIQMNCNVETVKIDFTEDDIRVRGIEDAAMVMEIQKQMYQGFSQNAQGMTEQFGEPMVINNVSVMGKKMMGNIEGSIVTFKRKK